MAVLTYALSRYAPIIQFFILVRSTRPMSETVFSRRAISCVSSECTDDDVGRSTVPLLRLVHGMVVDWKNFRRCHVNNVIQAAAGLLSILSPTSMYHVFTIEPQLTVRRLVFSTLRVYALSGGHQVLTAVAFLFCCVPFGINAVRPYIVDPEYFTD